MGPIASQITSDTIVYSTVYSGADQRKHQCPASLAFVWGIRRWPVNSPHKSSVTRKMFPFHDVIMMLGHLETTYSNYCVPLLFFGDKLWEICLSSVHDRSKCSRTFGKYGRTNKTSVIMFEILKSCQKWIFVPVKHKKFLRCLQGTPTNHTSDITRKKTGTH